jgi:DNA segregation ATPase FtsK/SpoIIIE-like protein
VSESTAGRGLGDVLGILLISASILLLAALFTYDLADVPANSTEVNVETRNWIGGVGAWTAFGVFFFFGGGAFLLPLLLFFFRAELPVSSSWPISSGAGSGAWC